MNPDLLGKALEACGVIPQFMDIVEQEAESPEGAEELVPSDIAEWFQCNAILWCFNGRRT